ncbi:MAG: hypothetical protein H6581_27200 [Bacteroidia bacterium]|nr:hypothetical protein [Bacteroidia bacterium]
MKQTEEKMIALMNQILSDTGLNYNKETPLVANYTESPAILPKYLKKGWLVYARKQASGRPEGRLTAVPGRR